MLRNAFVATVLLLLFGPPAFGAATFSGESRRITLTYVNCASAKDGVPTVTAGRVPDPTGKPPQVLAAEVRQVAYGIHELTFELTPGIWSVGATSMNTRYCGSRDYVTVLRDHDRHIVAAGVAYIWTGPSCSVAGTLPIPGLSVRLLSEDGKSVPVAIDDNAYYSDSFGSGKYDLEVRATGLASIVIPLDYSDQPPGEFCGKRVVRNITLDELRELPKSKGSIVGP